MFKCFYMPSALVLQAAIYLLPSISLVMYNSTTQNSFVLYFWYYSKYKHRNKEKVVLFDFRSLKYIYVMLFSLFKLFVLLSLLLLGHMLALSVYVDILCSTPLFSTKNRRLAQYEVCK